MDEYSALPAAPASPEPVTAPDLPWAGLARALRRLSHNIRNHLNTADLEASLAGEIATDPEVRESLTRLRQSFGKITRELDSLLGRVSGAAVELIEVRQDELFNALRQDSEKHLGTGTPIDWEEVPSHPEHLRTDPGLVCRAVRELLDNAIRYRSNTDRSIRVRAGAHAGNFSVEIIEPKKAKPDMNGWGAQPFAGTEPTRYGVGLWAVQQWVSAMGGKLRREYDDNRCLLLTQLILPSGADAHPP